MASAHYAEKRGEVRQRALLIDGAQRVLRFFPDSTKGPVSSAEIPGIVLWGGGLLLSPDARWLLVARLSRATVDVMLIENFR